MSAPTTPAEMADWLEQYIFDIPEDVEFASGIIAYLRRQPTDAQKIEALKLVSDAAAYGVDTYQNSRAGWRYSYVCDGLAAKAWSNARAALRLLGLPTE